MPLRMWLDGYLEFSGEVEKYREDVEELRGDAAALLMRGVPQERAEEGAVIKELSIEGRRVNVKIESGSLVRAGDALLRLKNLLAERLGPKRRIGVRRIFVSRMELTASSDELDVDEARKLLEGVAEVIEEQGRVRLVFQNLTEQDLQSRMVDRAVKLVKTTRPAVEEAVKLAPFGTVLKSSPPKVMKFNREVASTAEELGWIKKFPGRGQWIFGPPMAALLRGITELIIEHVCRPLGFEEWMFPRLLPMDVFKKLSTYVEHLPEGLFYVCAPPREPALFDEFKREYALKRELRTDLLKNLLEEPSYVLDAVQCPPFYQYFSGEIVRLEDLPVKAYDVMGGWTWRNEAGGVEGIVRTNEFLRMEMVFLASPDDALRIRDAVIDASIELADKVLELEWRLVAGAPFYLSPEEAQKRMIDVSSTAKIPTLDVECYLPYRGPRDSAEWLEVTAATVHRTFYVDAFKIKEAKGRPIWTGCVGHGLTRWAAAILAQHGFDFNSWPEQLRKKLGKLPSVARTVT
ncbi:MAG: serine--tRNA ligase [Aigarchaeota archaeon]|nr:serine--tRNA ligase [Candidatus Pelearchaeum maunauluense]